MKVNIRGKNKFDLTDALRDYIEGRVLRLDEWFDPKHEIVANVLCKVYDKFHVVEITIPMKHLILRSESKADNMYIAADLAVDKIERQLLKYKGRINSIYKKRDGIGNYFSDLYLKQDESNQNDIHKLVKEKEVELTVMSVEEATLQMELLGHTFYMFINETNHKTTIIYLRDDGDYATIEAK